MPEEQPGEKILDSLLDFLRILTVRKSRFKSLLVVYQWKLLCLCGYMPELDRCARCGKDAPAVGFSVVDGGVVCSDCRNSGKVNLSLLYDLNFDIIKTLKFIANSDMKAFEKLALQDEIAGYLEDILKKYVSYHLDISKLKSESFITI